MPIYTVTNETAPGRTRTIAGITEAGNKRWDWIFTMIVAITHPLKAA